MIVDIGFNPLGHGPSFNQRLAESLSRLGWICEVWIPRNQRGPSQGPLVYRSCLPDLAKPGSVSAMARYGFLLWRSLVLSGTDARILKWPIANVFLALIASLASPFLGRKASQVVVVNFAPRIGFSLYSLVERVGLLWLRLATSLGLRSLGCPTHGLLSSYAHQAGRSPAPPEGPVRFCYLGRGCDSKGLGWLLETLYQMRSILAGGKMKWSIQAVLFSEDETLSA